LRRTISRRTAEAPRRSRRWGTCPATQASRLPRRGAGTRSGLVVTYPAQPTELTLNVAFNVDKEQALFTRAQLLDWLEAEGITAAAGHIPGSGFGPSVREEGRHYWQPLETRVGPLGVEALPRRSPSSEEAEREKHWSSRRDGKAGAGLRFCRGGAERRLVVDGRRRPYLLPRRSVRGTVQERGVRGRFDPNRLTKCATHGCIEPGRKSG
jgi:hypothetical protein